MRFVKIMAKYAIKIASFPEVFWGVGYNFI